MLSIIFFINSANTQELFSRLNYEEVLMYAEEFKKPFYIDLTASWCLPCKMMDETVFQDTKVIEYTHNNYIALKLDVEDFDAMVLRSEHKVTLLPTILFFNHKGKLVGKSEGLTTGTSFLETLKKYN